MGIQKQWEGDDGDESLVPSPPSNTTPPSSNIPRPPAGNLFDPSSLPNVRPDFPSGPGPPRPQQQGQQTQSGPNPWQGARPLIPPASWRPSGPTPPSGRPSRPSGPRVPPLPYIPQLRSRPQGPRGPPPPQFSGTSGQPVEWGGYETHLEDLPGGVGFDVYTHFPVPRGHPRGGSGSAIRGAGAGGARGADRGGRDTGAGSGRGGRAGRGR